MAKEGGERTNLVNGYLAMLYGAGFDVRFFDDTFNHDKGFGLWNL